MKLNIGENWYILPDDATDDEIQAFIDQELFESDVPIVGAASPSRPEPEDNRTVWQKIADALVGGTETAGTFATGMTGGTLGTILGAGTELERQLLAGNFGTPEAADAIERNAMKTAADYTYMPRTQAGQEMLTTVAKETEPVLGSLPAVIGTYNPGTARAIGQAHRMYQNVSPPGSYEAQRLRSVGAAEVPLMRQRVEMAQNLPVPLSGESGLTLGQASRDFSQLQRESQISKMPVGERLRQTYENQTENLLANMDTMVEAIDPEQVELPEIGLSVSDSLKRRKDVLWRRLNQEWKKAEAAGEMADPIDARTLAGVFDELWDMEDVAKNIVPIKRAAVRFGVAVEDPQTGRLVWNQNVPLNNLEKFRGRVNAYTTLADRREARARRAIINEIDRLTKEAGGDLYKEYRRKRTAWSNEFEDTELVEALTNTKSTSNARKIALENVVDKVLFGSPTEEIIKLRNSLQGSGRAGRQAWEDTRAAGLEWLKHRMVGQQSGPDRGMAVPTPAKFADTIRGLDRSGKLEAIWGPETAQTLRDLVEVIKLTKTAPPGSVNYSNTASGLLAIMDLAITGRTQGRFPIAAKALHWVVQETKDARLRSNVERWLQRQPGKYGQ